MKYMLCLSVSVSIGYRQQTLIDRAGVRSCTWPVKFVFGTSVCLCCSWYILCCHWDVCIVAGIYWAGTGMYIL